MSFKLFRRGGVQEKNLSLSRRVHINPESYTEVYLQHTIIVLKYKHLGILQ